MKLVIARETLQSGISAVQNLVATKSALPILSNVLLRAADGQLTLVSTDLDARIECTVPCTVKQPGETTAPARRIADIVATFPGGDITLDTKDGNVIELSSGHAQFHVLGQPAEEFPKPATFSEDKKLSLDQNVLKDLLHKTSFAISTDMNRLALTGMLFDLHADESRFVATDGRRLSFAKLATTESTVTGSFIVPRKAIAELERLMGDEEPIEILPGENRIAFRFANILLIAQLIDSPFPNYEQVIPKNQEHTATLNTAEFHQAARRAAVMTNDKNNLIRLKVRPKTMVVSTTTPDVGDVQDEVGVEYEGGEMEIGFNPHFLLDILKIVDTDQVAFNFKDPLSPGVLRLVGNDDFLYVIMPIKL